MKIAHAVRLLAFGFLLLIIAAVFSTPSAAQMAISVRIGPPPLPVYDQPVCPAPGYMWTPGYWAWDDDDGYYWVPGTWVEAPEPGLLWTPGYWGWNDGVYAWNAGYWGPTVGFYGGVNYGYGYFGPGFGGGEWRGGTFFYNTAVMHVNTVTIRNVYVNRTVIVNNTSHVAFNGGRGGVQARPTPEQVAYAHRTHTPPVASQVQHAREASKNRALFASTNHGRPTIAATAKPGEFSGKGVVRAKAAGGTYHAPKMSPKEARASAPGGRPGAENRPVQKSAANSRPAESRSAVHASTAHPGTARTSEAHPAEGHAAAGHAPAPRTSESRANGVSGAKPAPKPAPHASEPRAGSEPKAEHAAPMAAPRENRAAAKPAAAPKPAAAAKSAAKPRPQESHAAAKPAAAPKPSASRPAPAKSSARPATAPKPAAAPRPAPKPKPAAPEKHESAPPKGEHK